MKTIKVIAAVLDTRELTLYKEDGTTVSIPQGSPEVRRLIDEISPVVATGGVAEVSLQGAVVNHYHEFEDQSGGLVRFFKVAKKKVKEFFSHKDEETKRMPAVQQIIGRVPVPTPEILAEFDPPKVIEPPLQENLSSAIEDIMAHAVPVNSAEFTDVRVANSNQASHQAKYKSVADDDSGDTVIAVVDGEVIPGMENLRPQFAAAARKLGSVQGVTLFLQRLAKVMGKRRHSVEDLLKFMERGDLPIADDGSIVIYKILKRKEGEKDTFVDCHTRKVTQKVGSYVCMDESLVDHNRNHECSNGLHVARRGYLSQFAGDVCVMAKVNPEDVIAVPEYDANKMRVCGYHIVGLLPDADFEKLRRNQPITDTVEAQRMLGRVLSGQHVGIFEEVRITDHLGEGVVITPTNRTVKPATKPSAEAPVRHALALTNEKEEAIHIDAAPKVDAVAVAAQINEAKATGKSVRQLRAEELYRAYRNGPPAHQAQAAYDLLQYKKLSKVSWTTLGLTDGIGAEIQRITSGTKAETLVPEPLDLALKAALKQKEASEQKAPVLSPRTRMLQDLYAKVLAGNALAADELLQMKKAAKKGWVPLGLPADAGEVINRLLVKE